MTSGLTCQHLPTEPSSLHLRCPYFVNTFMYRKSQFLVKRQFHKKLIFALVKERQCSHYIESYLPEIVDYININLHLAVVNPVLGWLTK